MKIKSLQAFVLTLAVVAGLAWLGGFDFDHRGGDTFAVSLVALYLAGAAGFVAGEAQR